MIRAAPCNKCNEPICFFDSGEFHPDGKKKWILVDAAGVEEGDKTFDYKRHTKHWKTCKADSAVAFREQLAREKEEKEVNQNESQDAEIEF